MSNQAVDDAPLGDFLRRAGATPVLVDVGASGKVHEAWLPFSKASMFVGFDPDSRDLDPRLGGHFQSHRIVQKIVAGPEKSGTADFHLTAFPHCSSMLRPDAKVLDAWLFADLFKVERTVPVEVITLAAAMDEAGAATVDWLKIDAQGCDLSVLGGLDQARRDSILCIEIEPGFLQFYEGEQTFPLLHQALVDQGFWLAHLKPQAFPRVRSDTIQEAFGTRIAATDPAAKLLGTAPTAAEARYFRTLDHLQTHADSPARYAIAWVFAISTGQWGHGLELARAARVRFGETADVRFMWQSTITTVRALAQSPA